MGFLVDISVRKIIHIDMDAYYASVEQRDFPQLRGKPIVVGGPPNSRGVVSTASYEARKYGIHSAMPSSRVLKLCPKAIFVKPRFDVYKEVSLQIREIFFQYSDLVEPLSLDEAYIDVSNNKKNMKSATIIAQEILYNIFQKTKLTASGGLGPNKFVAKVASDFKKPNGLTVVTPDEVENFIANLPIGKFYGVGKVTEKKMISLGILSGKELRLWPLVELQKHFGKAGKYYFDIARGIDNRPVSPERIRKSVGVERTFKKDILSPGEFEEAIYKLAVELQRRIERQQTAGQTLTIKIKDPNFVVHSKQITGDKFIRDIDEIFLMGKKLFYQLLPEPRPLRLIGLTLSHLDTEKETTFSNIRQIEFPFEDKRVNTQ